MAGLLPFGGSNRVETRGLTELAVFQSQADERSGALVSELTPLRGTITADAEERFDALYETGRVIEAGGNARGRRELRDAEHTQPVLAEEGGRFIGAMYGAEEEDKRCTDPIWTSDSSSGSGPVP